MKWPTDVASATQLQLELAGRVRITPMKAPPRLVDTDGAVSIALAACAVFRVPEPLRRADRMSRALCKASGAVPL